MYNASRLALYQFLNYGLICMSIRYLAAGSYLGLAITDGAVAFCGFTIMQHVAKAETKLEQAGYVLGGIAGSMLGLWLTRNVK